MAKFTDEPRLNKLYLLAVNYAFTWHEKQVRKQGEPYFAHLMSVSALVLEAGGTQEEAIAALLHDAVEDVGAELSGIKFVFGDDVAYMVWALTEPKDLPAQGRKAAYVNAVRESSDAVKLISCADKLHNLRSYATDARDLWHEHTAEFYRQLIPIYADCPRVPRYWLEEMVSHFLKLGAELPIVPNIHE